MILCTLHPRSEPLPDWMQCAWLPHDTECQSCHGPLDEHLVGGLRCVRLEGSFTLPIRDLHAALTATHHRMGDFPLDVDRPAIARATAFGTL